MNTLKENMWKAFSIGRQVGHRFVGKSKKEIEDTLRKVPMSEMIIKEDIGWDENNPYYKVIQNLFHKDYISFEDFIKDIERDSTIESLSDLDRLRLFAYVKVLYYRVTAQTENPSRVAIWDSLFEFVDQNESKELHNEVLETYYNKVSLSDDVDKTKFAFSYSLYHYWHNTPYVTAIRSTLLNGGDTEFSVSLVSALLGINIYSIPECWLN